MAHKYETGNAGYVNEIEVLMVVFSLAGREEALDHDREGGGGAQERQVSETTKFF